MTHSLYSMQKEPYGVIIASYWYNIHFQTKTKRYTLLKTEKYKNVKWYKSSGELCRMCKCFNAVTQIQQRRGTWHGREQSHEQDHKDGPWKGSPGLQELACCSYPPRTWSYWQPTRIWTYFLIMFFFDTKERNRLWINLELNQKADAKWSHLMFSHTFESNKW